MKTVAIIGGIGSGKSHICRLFEKEGVEIFHFDDEAKSLYYNQNIKKHVIELFGEDIYKGIELNKPKLSNIIFNDKSKLE